MRTRAELEQETQCPHCSGAGVADDYGFRHSCSFCGGSGLLKPPKMRAQCECGERQPRWTTAFTTYQWMRQHLCSHAPETPEEA